MSENLAPTLNDIHNELTAFILERDQEFRHFKTDVASITRESKRCVDVVQSEDDEDTHKIYDARKLALTAEYNLQGTEHASAASSIIFTLGLLSIKQIVQLPAALLPYVDGEQRAYYSDGNSGDLNELRRLEYVVRNYADSTEVNIVRTIEYALCDGDTPLYTAQYPSAKHTFERVAVAQEMHTIVVPPRIEEEKNTDPGDQLPYDMAFRDILNDPKDPSRERRAYEQDSILSIQALLKILRSSAPLPHPNDTLYEIKIITPPKSSS